MLTFSFGPAITDSDSDITARHNDNLHEHCLRNNVPDLLRLPILLQPARLVPTDRVSPFHSNVNWDSLFVSARLYLLNEILSTTTESPRWESPTRRPITSGHAWQRPPPSWFVLVRMDFFPKYHPSSAGDIWLLHRRGHNARLHKRPRLHC